MAVEYRQESREGVGGRTCSRQNRRNRKCAIKRLVCEPSAHVVKVIVDSSGNPAQVNQFQTQVSPEHAIRTNKQTNTKTSIPGQTREGKAGETNRRSTKRILVPLLLPLTCFLRSPNIKHFSLTLYFPSLFYRGASRAPARGSYVQRIGHSNPLTYYICLRSKRERNNQIGSRLIIHPPPPSHPSSSLTHLLA